MMSYKEWNRSDALSLHLHFTHNPLAAGSEGLERVLEIIERAAGFLMPDTVLWKRKYRYSRQRAREQLAKISPTLDSLILSKERGDVQGSVSLDFGGTPGGLTIDIFYSPLNFFREESASESRCQQVVHFARALCHGLGPVDYGGGHSYADFLLGSDPHTRSATAPAGAYEAFWINIYGKPLVDSLGRERVLALPAHSVEPLPCGGVLWLSRPTMADFDSPQARAAQARCLVHLRPELRLEEVERTLLERSIAFQPVEKQFDPDISGVIELLLKRTTGLSTLRKEIERYNRYRPPPVTEWRPAAEVASDAEDPARKIAFYEVQAEGLIAVLHTRIDSVLGQEPGSIIEVDDYVMYERWAEFQEYMPQSKRDRLVPMLGAYLGELLIKHLGGRWVPRRSLLESAVVGGPPPGLALLRGPHQHPAPGTPQDLTPAHHVHQAVRLASV
jgi:hypothetical protein